MKRIVVTVIGSATEAHHERSTAVGLYLAQAGVHLLTGGGGGVMAAVSKSFVEGAPERGLAIGIIPCEPTKPTKAKRGYPNASVELCIRTHLDGTDGPKSHSSRNHINVLSADLVVRLPGGQGTQAEWELAEAYERPRVDLQESPISEISALLHDALTRLG